MRLLAITLVAALFSPAASWAQAEPPEGGLPAPPNLAFTQDHVELIRDGLSHTPDAQLPLIEGDRLRTTSGRAEIVFGDGTLGYLDRDATLDVLSVSLVRLLEGQILLITPRGRGPDAAGLQIDTPGGSVLIRDAGEYRVAVGPDAVVTLSVARGLADLRTDAGAVAVGAGYTVSAFLDERPPMPEPFNAAAWDGLMAWADERRDARTGSASTAYLPDALYPYAGVLEQYGQWAYLPDSGYVWYPQVAPTWRPYYNGYWLNLGYRGATWAGFDPWAWPTHHYGRWGFRSGRWFWRPARVWGPAWVAWANAPGLIGWCPLGFDGRPVFGLRAGIDLYRADGVYDAWHAWTVVRRDRFDFRRPVGPHAIPGRAIDPRARSVFVVQRRSPLIASTAPPPSPAAVLRPSPGLPSPGRYPLSASRPRRVSGPPPVSRAVPRAARPPTGTGVRTPTPAELAPFRTPVRRPDARLSRVPMRQPGPQPNGPRAVVPRSPSRAAPVAGGFPGAWAAPGATTSAFQTPRVPQRRPGPAAVPAPRPGRPAGLASPRLSTGAVPGGNAAIAARPRLRAPAGGRASPILGAVPGAVPPAAPPPAPATGRAVPRHRQ